MKRKKTFDIDITFRGTTEDYRNGKDIPWQAEDYDYTNRREAIKEAKALITKYIPYGRGRIKLITIAGVRVVRLIKDKDGDIWDVDDVFVQFVR